MQPANKRTPLGIDAFWNKPTPNPPLRWKKWRLQYIVVLLANVNIILDTLAAPKIEMGEFAVEPIYEKTIIGSSGQSELDRNARNSQHLR